MSVTTPRGESFVEIYGPGQGRGDVESHILQTLRLWIVAYIADYEAERGLTPRSLPVPPTPESIHGGIDYETFYGENFPEIIVVTQPTGEVERYGGEGDYGSWFDIGVGAIVQVEGDQNATRLLGDAYGTALQKLLPQQGEFGTNPDGSAFATRTRLHSAYGLSFPDDTVRDVIRATVMIRTFISQLVADFDGPRIPPQDPYAIPLPWPEADKIDVNVVRATPDEYDAGGTFTADAVILDATVNPEITEFQQVTVIVPANTGTSS